MSASNLIYGLIDPRSRLIRYVGLSSIGMRRPRQHRSGSHNAHCNNWIKALHKLGLDYEIVVLEVLEEQGDLGQAERWWIAYGRACDWPLMNLTAGGAPSAEALARMKASQEARIAAVSPPRLYSKEVLNEFARSRKIKDLGKLIENPATDNPLLLKLRDACFCLFDEGRSRADTIVGLDLTPAEEADNMGIVSKYIDRNVVPELVDRLHKLWLTSRCFQRFDEGVCLADVKVMHPPWRSEDLASLHDSWLYARCAQLFGAGREPKELSVEICRLRFDATHAADNATRTILSACETPEKIWELYKRWKSERRAHQKQVQQVRRLHPTRRKLERRTQ